ncbi:GerAB/ArcD/ProY family transporter [Oceanirhabdus seepicola]|uniref:GerAB/ArcD/ProY family transporter n=1 Tax=Oceanirhabdus seepicola TaxID=2828781 RepID=A0A9J6P0P2_9CLOT|nr:GerAB/ArcD/ProY family transporter [Oceanirhabdus seepicola]MCM1989956.1 GerAB/ArcD/ProY family transporter [Oceanirhabdus seepicola]
MNIEKNNLLTPNQFTYLLIGFIVGAGVLTLPNELVKTAGQDAWMSVIIALIYPLYVVFISMYIINKHPKENVLILNKKYFGNLFGSILNFILMMQFMITYIVIIANTIIFSRVFIVSFLGPLKVAMIIVFLATYSAYKGPKGLGKMSELIFYLFIPVFLFSLSGLKYGSILNMQPMFGAGIENILKSTPQTAYSYSGWEAILLLFPYVNDVKCVKRCALKAVAICGIIYVWAVFISIFYLGIDIVPKSYWSLILVFESINIPIINNFRYIFMYIWMFLALRGAANYHFSVALFLNDFKKIELKKMCLLIYPLSLYLGFKFTDIFLKQKVVAFGLPFCISFNLIFFTVLALLIHLKGKKTKNYN